MKKMIMFVMVAGLLSCTMATAQTVVAPAKTHSVTPAKKEAPAKKAHTSHKATAKTDSVKKAK